MSLRLSRIYFRDLRLLQVLQSLRLRPFLSVKINRLYPSYVCPLGQAVFITFLEAIFLPLKVLTLDETASKWSGLTHKVTLHKWSIVRPSGIGPLCIS
jgi:hypothetical protein